MKISRSKKKSTHFLTRFFPVSLNETKKTADLLHYETTIDTGTFLNSEKNWIGVLQISKCAFKSNYKFSL